VTTAVLLAVWVFLTVAAVPMAPVLSGGAMRVEAMLGLDRSGEKAQP
jgi:hypothetical protein